MPKLISLVLFSLLVSVPLARADKAALNPVRIEVGPGKEVVVTVPCISSKDLQEIIAGFLSGGDDKVREKIFEVVRRSSGVTLVLTTKQ